MTADVLSVFNLPSAVADNNCDLPVYDQTKLVLNDNLSAATGAEGGKFVYDYAVGDPSFTTRVSSQVSVTRGPKVLVPSFQWTVGLTTDRLRTDADGNTRSVGTPGAGFWVTSPINDRLTDDELYLLILSTISLIGPSITAGAISKARLTNVSRIKAKVY